MNLNLDRLLSCCEVAAKTRAAQARVVPATRHSEAAHRARADFELTQELEARWWLAANI